MPTLHASLAHKIHICALIEQLDEMKCLDAIRLFQDELGCNNLNELLIKMVNNLKHTFTINCLKNIETNMCDIVYNKTNSKYSSEEPKWGEKINKYKENYNNNRSKLSFSLVQVPLDLIMKTAFFLDENDIVSFEKCCRIFYQIINNTSYLNKCMCFKMFVITKTRLQQMAQSQCSFFKYSKANILKFKFISGLRIKNSYRRELEMFLNVGKPLWEKVQQSIHVSRGSKIDTSIENENTKDWLTILYKSVECIQFDALSSLLLSQLPINILFDPNQSQLKHIILDHSFNGQQYYYNLKFDVWNHCMLEFQTKYYNLQQKLNQQAKHIKSLDFIHHTNMKNNYNVNNSAFKRAVPCILSKNVWMGYLGLDFDNLYKNQLFVGLKTLTIESGCHIINKDIIHHVAGNQSCIQIEIETLRILDFDVGNNSEIFNNEKVIQLLKLHQNLKNLTIRSDDFSTTWLVALKNILSKKYYLNLKNVNILLKNITIDDPNEIAQIFQMFQILKKNQHWLQYDFQQINIGFELFGHSWFVFKCNDTKGKHSKILDTKMNDIYSTIQKKATKEGKEEYNTLLNKWVDQHIKQSNMSD